MPQRSTLLVPLWTVIVIALLLTGSTPERSTYWAEQQLRKHYGSRVLPGAVDAPVGLASAQPAELVPSADTGFEILFAHVGNGAIRSSDLSFQTVLILTNSTDRATQGWIQFYDDTGQPLVLGLNGEVASHFDFEMTGRETRRFVTDGTGDVTQGWARVHSDQALSASLSFGIRDSQGTIYTDVGVAESESGTDFTLFADSMGQTSTAIAMANPDESRSVEIECTLFDATGTELASAQRGLAAGGHLALFLDQLFPNVGGINEFVGSVILRSEDPFLGITLRSTGDVLTSMPLVMPPGENANWDQLAFPHVGDGQNANLRITTSIILINNTDAMTTGTVDFYTSEGSPMAVTIDGETGISFPFQLEAGAVLRLMTEGERDLRAGWAEVNTDQPIEGTALFTIYDHQGRLDTEVGVASAYLYKRFNLIADSLGDIDTGIALANPGDASEPVRVELNLRNQWGAFQQIAVYDIPPRQHMAIFLTEIFPEVNSIDEFQGLLQVSASGYVAPMSLRQAGLKLTSAPILLKRYGFEPTNTIEWSQYMAGASPALYWSLFQRSGDYTISRVTLSAPQIGLQDPEWVAGEHWAAGVAPRTSSSEWIEFVALGDGGNEFQLLSANYEGYRVYATGTLEGEPAGGLRLSLQFNAEEGNLPPVLPSDAHLRFTFPLDLFVWPSDAGEVTLTTELESAPLDGLSGARILRREEETFEIQAPDSVPRANISRIEPVFLEGGREITIHGSNFDENSLVRFEGYGGELRRVLPLSVSETEIEVVVPDEILSDERVWVETPTGGRSRPYYVRTLFNPMLKMLKEGDYGLVEVEEGWGFLVLQSGWELLASEFEVHLIDADADFSELSPGEEVGRVDHVHSYHGRRLIVDSVDTNRVQLELVNPYDLETSYGTLTLERVSDDWSGLKLVFEQADFPEGPFVESSLTWQWTFTALPLLFGDPRELRNAWASFLSSPQGQGGRSLGLRVSNSTVFVWP